MSNANTRGERTIVRKPHISLNVRDVDASVLFCRTLFDIEPVKHYREDTIVHSVLRDDQGEDSRRLRSGYAKFDLKNPALNFVLNQVEYSRGGIEGALSHLGLQMDSTDDVLAMRHRMAAARLVARDEMQVSCCDARQDTFRLADPDGNAWEIFTVLEHLSPQRLRELDRRGKTGASACGTGCATPAPVAEIACCAH